MKAITVKQPWAWAIIHGGKNIENRTQNFTYRGPLLVHAAKVDDPYGYYDRRVVEAGMDPDGDRGTLARGEIIGVADLVDCHRSNGIHCRFCGSSWGNDGWDTRHLVLKHPIVLPHPVAARGMLGLWTPPEDVMAAVQAQLVRAVLR